MGKQMFTNGNRDVRIKLVHVDLGYLWNDLAWVLVNWSTHLVQCHISIPPENVKCDTGLKWVNQLTNTHARSFINRKRRKTSSYLKIKEKNVALFIKRNYVIVVPWWSDYHYCTTSFSKGWNQLLHKFIQIMLTVCQGFVMVRTFDKSSGWK